MKKNDDPVFDELLVKYLLGDASDTEKAGIQQWLKASDENKKAFYDFKLIWNQSRHLAAGSSMDENEAWERFKLRTETVQKRPGIIAEPVKSYKWLSIAAGLILLVSGCWIAWLMTREVQPMHEIAKKTDTAVKANDGKITAAPAGQPDVPEPKEERKTAQYPAQAVTYKKHGQREMAITQKKEHKLNRIFDEDCSDHYKYHGPKYDSNFDN